VAGPLTGLLVSPEAALQHPIAVMVDDHADARPQSGFNAASIVWHAPAEGGVPRYMMIFQDQIPAGVVNIVHGAHDAVNGLLDHPEIDAISFVGQASTALHVMDRGTRSGKRVQALGGAKNSMVVMDDADLDQAVPAMMQSAFGNAKLAGRSEVSADDVQDPRAGRRQRIGF